MDLEEGQLIKSLAQGLRFLHIVLIYCFTPNSLRTCIPCPRLWIRNLRQGTAGMTSRLVFGALAWESSRSWPTESRTLLRMCLGAPAHVLAPGRAFGEWVCQEEGKKQVISWLGHQVMVYSSTLMCQGQGNQSC